MLHEPWRKQKFSYRSCAPLSWRAKCDEPNVPPPPHPGEILRECVLPELAISVAEAARQPGVSRVQFSRFINGRSAVSADLAIRLALWLGGSAPSWMRLQADYDPWQAEYSGKPAPTVKRIAA